MQPARRSKGFRRTSTLVDQKVRAVTGQRGFAETRILTHWDDIVGPETASMCRPVDVKYTRTHVGATLTLLTTGAMAPILKMQEPGIRERVNACYGYNAIGKIRITQTAPTGFAEGQVSFQARPKTPSLSAQEQHANRSKAAIHTSDVQDEGLRAALEHLGANIISKQSR
ncbi:DUF721 domain-containing protein [Thalassobacter stenotrophicus]|uniref:Zn-ribbon-containing, possibly RNA-binding protein and truncated derivatives n=2 Tax=Thalassobacter stenotrophicus TaxID=266809 RepID=A0A0N7LTH4_9RHOB|nr:DciA family protein [Thalassobacter stenotrophicus]PVZ49428.1 DUF721 domain-containing protein [Thalassobacter stenotrophicus]CUH60706.1 Zn-ribbon-containing, possibly RNA-binding protein and truncated derivatives [Thalassobacter stenotrophicus]SHJ31243.1 hypothetical protein SAMN02744035_03320 [Thalassobacter stenotrophicus DSM 16310]